MYSNADPVLWQLPGPIKGGCKGKDQNAKEPKGVTSPKHRGIALRIISLGMTRNVRGEGPKPGKFYKHISLKFPGFGGGRGRKANVSLQATARLIRPESRRTLLERSGSPRNMFEGGLSSFPPFDERTFGAELTVFSPAASGGLSQGRP